MRFLARRFRENNSGNFAVAASLAAVPLAVAVGLAVDYSEALRHRAVLQQTLDAAVLVGCGKRMPPRK
jgi:Flp pilus assembly protein TadG